MKQRTGVTRGPNAFSLFNNTHCRLESTTIPLIIQFVMLILSYFCALSIRFLSVV